MLLNQVALFRCLNCFRMHGYKSLCLDAAAAPRQSSIAIGRSFQMSVFLDPELLPPRRRDDAAYLTQPCQLWAVCAVLIRLPFRKDRQTIVPANDRMPILFSVIRGLLTTS